MSNIPNPLPPSHEGWYYSKLSGTYKDIGYQHGSTHAYLINKIIDRLRSYTYWATGFEWAFLRQKVWDLWWNRTPSIYQEEMQGIAQGATAKGAPNVTAPDIFLWNAYLEVLYYYCPTFKKELMGGAGALPGKANAPDSCSAFIAVGSQTSDGAVVMAHNTFTGFELAYNYLILDITTPQGDRFVMQTAPGQICSNTDFGVNNKGLMITETTIGGFDNYCSDSQKLATLVPEFVRARMAMEQAGSFDDFVKITRTDNTGGYANSWLVGDAKNKRIMRYELGYRYDARVETSDGYFVGFNAAIDPRIRNLECSNTGYMDPRRHQGARQVRLPMLLDKYKGKLTTEVAKSILADHYDPYLSQVKGEVVDNPCARNVDAHYELDPRLYMSQAGRPLPYQPQGAVDGKVMDSTTAKSLNFGARWGSSGDIAFDADKFFQQHPQFVDLQPYTDSRPNRAWTTVEEIGAATRRG